MRFADKAALGEIQYCVIIVLSNGGLSAFQPVFGSDPVDMFSWGDDDRDLGRAQKASVSSQFSLRWKLRIMAEEATLREMANGKLRPKRQRSRYCNWRFGEPL